VIFNRRVVVWFAALIVVVNGFFPAVWILLTSFKTETELLKVPITYLPEAATLANYELAFTAQPILRFMWNSFVVASLSTILCVFVGALAAYALTRLRMPYRNLIMSVLLAVAMFPLISLMVPLFKLMREAGLLNTSLALILPYAVLSLPICTLVMAAFFQDIPPDLEAADDRRVLARRRAVPSRRAARRAGRVHRRHPRVRERMGRVPAGTVAERERVDAHAARRHHALPGRVHVSLADHLRGAGGGDRAGGGADRGVPGARGGRAHAGRLEGLRARGA
jgi:hypothetical protein